ncbi:proteinase inhibitor kazal [Stemphylium lycopersici]|uniref:Proteinase inhibitor kazal n=1 Tax=Stemphylium lycopersici TaxID=183478 RepID=A0A364MYH1_STELY|nr:proteinase inhibitor kazal [Stemphylium lycopersici]RAR06816.1 proteinase inhibitor kazal [Stemphylium lycopersici]
MKALFLLLPLFSSVLAFPHDAKGEDCEANCPLVNCALCECINNRESLCKEICATYEPKYQRCPRDLAHVRTAELDPATCECEEVICTLQWPEGCHCINDGKRACYEKCGVEPMYLDCSASNVKREAEPEPAPEPEPEPEPASAACECEEVACPQVWPESCYCANDVKKACFDKCGGPPPLYQTCPPRSMSVRDPKPEPEPEPKSVSATCECEEVICPQVWPESCHCANDAKKACFAKCGGPVPPLDVCIAHNVAAREPEPEPAPAPCSCPDVQCPESWPESCYCERDAKQACAHQCGGTLPIEDNCPPRYITARAPEPAPTPSCVCDDVACIQSWPESCFCANDAKRACFEKCGGEEAEYETCLFPDDDDDDGASIPDVTPAPEPVDDYELCYQECGGEKPVPRNCSALLHPGASPSLTTVFLPSSSSASPTSMPPLIPRHSRPQNQICGGGRGTPRPACPAGQVCIADPFEPGSCGPACDQTGICVEDKACGGFGGFACEVEGQVCVDDPRDDCSDEGGWDDCAGVCVWPA